MCRDIFIPLSQMSFLFRKICMAFLLLAGFSAAAQQKTASFYKHEISVGAGDMLFETVQWHNQVHREYGQMRPGVDLFENTGYSYTPHLFIEYYYRVADWLNIGFDYDMQYTSWREDHYDASGIKTTSTPQHFYNVCMMPSLRFNYLIRKHLNLYSTISVGMDINGGTMADCFGNKTIVGAAADLRLIGFRFGGGHYWGFVDLGLLAALKDQNTIFLLGSELCRVGFTYKFNKLK